MSVGWILAFAALGQYSDGGWQASSWPSSAVAPTQHTAPSTNPPAGASQPSAQHYAQPATAPYGNYGYTGQSSWPTLQPPAQPAVQGASQPSSSQFSNVQQPQNPDSRAALAAEYQSQIDDRLALYANFYRQPNPQLPPFPAASPSAAQPQPQAQPSAQPQTIGQSGVNWTSQPGTNQPALPGNSVLQPPPPQPGYSQPAYDPRAAAATSSAPPPVHWPQDIYQPQPQPASGAGGTSGGGLAQGHGAATLQPALSSTLPTGTGQFADAPPSLHPPAGIPPSDADEASRTAGAGRRNRFNQWSDNRNDPRPSPASAQEQPQPHWGTANLNPVPTGGGSGISSGFHPGGSSTASGVSLLSSLSPTVDRQTRPAQYEQSLGGGGGSSLFAASSLGNRASSGDDSPTTAEIPGEKPWRPLVVCMLGLFISLGGNLYLGWIAFESHFRYRRLLVDGDDDDDRPRRGASRRPDRRSHRDD